MITLITRSSQAGSQPIEQEFATPADHGENYAALRHFFLHILPYTPLIHEFQPDRLGGSCRAGQERQRFTITGPAPELALLFRATQIFLELVLTRYHELYDSIAAHVAQRQLVGRERLLTPRQLEQMADEPLLFGPVVLLALDINPTPEHIQQYNHPSELDHLLELHRTLHQLAQETGGSLADVQAALL